MTCGQCLGLPRAADCKGCGLALCVECAADYSGLGMCEGCATCGGGCGRSLDEPGLIIGAECLGVCAAWFCSACTGAGKHDDRHDQEWRARWVEERIGMED